MTDAQIANSGAPAWEKTIMTAMAHYGMYVNDTDGIDNIETRSRIRHLLHQPRRPLPHGQLHLPAGRLVLLAAEPVDHGGPGHPLNKLRVVDPCWAEGLCNGSGTTTSDPTPPTTTPPATHPPTSTPPASTPPHHSGLDRAAGHHPLSPRAHARRQRPVTTKPSPVPRAGQAPPQEAAQDQRPNSAHAASVSARSCRASRSKKGAKRAACATAVAATKRRPAGQR